ncbi:hypothetical protein Hanom_Chr00s000003g01602791 [Helianthus anomalus]
MKIVLRLTLMKVSDDYDSESLEILHNAFKSIMPPDMFKSFAGFFGTQGSYHGLHCEEKKKQLVEEIIDVTKEMNAENLTDIAEKP